ncbi:MAG TPA: nucleotidyltransferase family protein [Longimicrobiaceae bacterium]|nr:nucleotidyltransferase family protein [Longimicrobiaceae bacterium]
MSTPALAVVTDTPELPLDTFDLDADAVRARFDRARRDGHHTWLWPEVAVGAWRDALRGIEAATRGVLAGEAAPPRLDGDPSALGIAAYTSGMGPLLGYWVESGALAADPGTAAVLRLHLHHNRLRMERLTRAAVEAIARLGEAGVVPVVLKGMHTAHTYFPEPGTRPVCDIDLLVVPGDLPAVERALRPAGYRPGLVQRRPYKCDWVPVGADGLPRSLSLTHAGDPYSLDTHTSLDRNFFGVATVRLDRVPLSPAPWEVAPPARVPGQPLLTLLLATHASEGLHGLSLVRLVELARVVRHDAASGALAWDGLLHAARAAGALRFAYPALELCERLAPGTIPGPVLERFAAAATPAMRRVLARATPATAQRLDGLSLEERFMWAGTPWEHARRVAHAVWPAPAGRSLTELGRIYGRRAWRLLRGRVDR